MKKFSIAVIGLLIAGSVNAQLVQNDKIIPVAQPQDFSTAVTTTVVSLKNYGRATFICQFGSLGTDAVGVSTITVHQATSVSFATQKALTVTSYWVNGVSGDIYTNTSAAAITVTSADDNKAYIIEIKSDDLDVNNSYDCVQLKFTDYGTNAALGAVTAVLSEPRYTGDQNSQPTALTN